MDCIENRLRDCNKRVVENVAGAYLNPDTMKYYDFIDGVNTSFNIDDDSNFRNFYIGSKSPAKLRKEKEEFLNKLKSLDVENILGRGWKLTPEQGFVKINQKRNPATKFITCFISLEIPKTYEESYQIEKQEEINGLQDVINNLETGKKSLEEIEKLRKLKVQKYLDEHPHLNKVFININGKKVLYTQTSNGIVRGGDQLKLNFNAPLGESEINKGKKTAKRRELFNKNLSNSEIRTIQRYIESLDKDTDTLRGLYYFDKKSGFIYKFNTSLNQYTDNRNDGHDGFEIISKYDVSKLNSKQIKEIENGFKENQTKPDIWLNNAGYEKRTYNGSNVIVRNRTTAVGNDGLDSNSLSRESNRRRSNRNSRNNQREGEMNLNAPTEDSGMLPPEFDLPPMVYEDYGLEDYETIPVIPDVTPEEEIELPPQTPYYQDTRMETEDEILDNDFEEDYDLSMPFEEYLTENNITIKPEELLSNREYGKILEGLINKVIESKKVRIQRLSERVSSLKKLGKSTQQRIQYQREIKNLQKEIDELVKKRGRYISKTVEQAIKDEILELEKIVTPKTDSDGNVILDPDGNPIYDIPIDRDLIAIEQFENRLNNLVFFLIGRKVDGSSLAIGEEILTDVPFDNQIMLDKELSFYIRKVDTIERRYKTRRAELILDYAKSDIAKKHFKSEKERKEFEEIAIDFLKHPEKTIDEIFRGIAPKALLQIADAEQGLGIFGAILKTYFYDEQRGFERQVKALYDEIKQLEKNIKEKVKDFNSSIFYKIDELGNRTNRLTTLFKDNWKNFFYTLVSNQNSYRYRLQNNYSNKKKQEAFYEFKKNITENAEIFQLQEYEEIWDLIKEYDKVNGTDFSTILSSFKPSDFSNKTSYSTYTKYNKQDSKHFQREVIDRAKQQLITYLDNLVIEDKEKDDKFILEDGRNPFVFAKEFVNTHNYNKDLIQAWSVDYTTLIPKKEKYYDENFSKNIASNDDIQNLWNKYEELLVDNINAALIESGSRISSDEIPIDLDITKSELFKTQKFFKRLSIRWENSHWWVEKFYTKNYAKTREESSRKSYIESFLLSGNSFLRKLKSYLKNYDKTQLEVILNEKDIKYKSWDDYLKEFNFKESSVTSKNKDYYRRLQQRYVGYLASLIAYQDVLNSSSLDLSDNIGQLAQGVIMMQARKKTQIFADAILNFLRENKRGEHENDKEYNRIMDLWSQRNIYGNNQIATANAWRLKRGKGKNINTTQNQISDQYKNIKTLPQSFYFDKTKYEIRITLKNENNEPVNEAEKLKILFQTNINQQLANNDVKEIEVSGKKYYVNVSYFKEDRSKIITREEYLNTYKNKLQQDEENERLYFTWRSAVDGLISITAGKSLMLNAESGVKNRFEGEFTNIRLAAQGLFNYGMRELYAAKRFLNLAGLAKAKPINALARIAPDHYKQLKIYELFTQQMSLFQDHTNLDLADNEKYSLTAWAIEFPETHNQGENILSTLIYNQIKVKDINGKEHLLFDENEGKYGKFIIFDEDEAVKNNRLKLKSEFDTEENRALWQNWISYKDNNRSLQLIHDCAINVTRAQGNYEQGDVAAIQSNQFGRPTWQFKRWAFSHLKQRYNDTTIDYRAGELNQKGMMNVLMEHPGALVPFLLLDTLMTIGTSPKTLIKGWKFSSPLRIIWNIFELGAQLGVPVWLICQMFKSESKIDWHLLNLKQEINLGFSFIFGSLLRATTTTVNQASLKIDQYTPLQTNKYVVESTEKLYDKVYKNSKIPIKERRIISGAMQTTANHIYLYGLFFGINALINMLLELSVKCEEGDKDCEEEKENTVKRTEKSMFFLINLWHNLVDDDKKWWNPFTFFDNMGSVSLLENGKRLLKIWNKVESEEADFGDKVIYATKNLPQPLIPSQMVSPLVYGIAAGFSSLGIADESYKEDYLNLVEFPFQDRFVYDNKSFDFLLKDRQAKVKTYYNAYKASIDDLAKDYIRSLKEIDANGIEDRNYDKDLKWFKKEFKTKIFGAGSQNEVMINLMDDKEYRDLLDINYYKAKYYSEYKKYPSEDEIDKKLKRK